MVKRKRKSKKRYTVLHDWERKEIILHENILVHVKKAGHSDAHKFISQLKKNISNPEFVVRSKNRKDTKIANIRLKHCSYEYLHVVIRYGSLFEAIFLRKKNFIVTFYPTHKPKRDEIIWTRK